MYSNSTDPEKPPKRPVVGSLAGALNELDNWLKENQYESLSDADGLAWKLDLKVSQAPVKGDPKGLVWRVRIGLRRELDAEDLLAAGILKLPEDERLLGLIGDEIVPLAMKPALHEVPGELEARRLVADELPRLKATLAKKSLIDIKRSLIGRWVDERSRFGGAEKSLTVPNQF
jgi:hypothetical protein